MSIYLDVSSLDRPFDDQSQLRVRFEAEAVVIILSQIAAGRWRHASSEMVLIEISAIPDLQRRQQVMALLPANHDIISLNDSIDHRASSLVAMGFKAADAVHLAAAEAQRADVLLTCDDRLLRRARRWQKRLAVKVENPVEWLKDQTHGSNA